MNNSPIHIKPDKAKEFEDSVRAAGYTIKYEDITDDRLIRFRISFTQSQDIENILILKRQCYE